MDRVDGTVYRKIDGLKIENDPRWSGIDIGNVSVGQR
jgi:hypothetical protein